MKKIVFCFMSAVLLIGCTVDPIEDYESQNVDKTKIQRPGSQGINMDEIDKDKVQRPGSQGGN